MTRRAHGRGGIDWLGPDKAKIRTRTAPDPLTGKRRQVSRIVYGTPDEVETLIHRVFPNAEVIIHQDPEGIREERTTFAE